MARGYCGIDADETPGFRRIDIPALLQAGRKTIGQLPERNERMRTRHASETDASRDYLAGLTISRSSISKTSVEPPGIPGRP